MLYERSYEDNKREASMAIAHKELRKIQVLQDSAKVAEYLESTFGIVTDDPIGFLITSNNALLQDRRNLVNSIIEFIAAKG